MRILIFLAVIGLLLVNSIHASAADHKLYSGYSCITDNKQDDVQYHFGAVLNKSHSGKRFRCAITRDAGRIERAWVRVINNHKNEELQCWIYTVAFDRYVYKDARDRADSDKNDIFDRDRMAKKEAYASTYGYPRGEVINLVFANGVNPDQLIYSIDGSAVDGKREIPAYFLECIVPGIFNTEKSGIFSYRIREGN